MENDKLFKIISTCALFEFKIYNFIDERNRLLAKRDEILKEAEKVLLEYELDSNSGNELIFIAYGSLKETIVSLYDKVEQE